MHQLVNTEMQKVVDFCVYLHTHLPGSSDFLCFVHCQIVEVQRCKAIYDHVTACKVMSSLGKPLECRMHALETCKHCPSVHVVVVVSPMWQSCMKSIS